MSATDKFTIEDGVLKKYNGRGGNVVIPRSVKEIADFAFSDSNIKSLTIYDNLSRIGSFAFANCNSLTAVYIGEEEVAASLSEDEESETEICELAFACCTALKTVVLGTCVKSIGDGAYQHCAGMTSIVFPDDVKFGKNVFIGCEKLETDVAKYGQETVLPSKDKAKSIEPRRTKAIWGRLSAFIDWLDVHKKKVLIVGMTISSILLFAAIIVAIVMPITTNIFRVGKVQKIELFDAPERVEKILGEPYIKIEEDGKTVWRYYDKKYLSAVEQQKEIPVHSYIEVTFEDSVVSSVFLDKKRAATAEKKEVEKTEMTSDNVIAGYYKDEGTGLYGIALGSEIMRYSTRYADGSYYLGAIKFIDEADIPESELKSNIKFEWSNGYSDYSVTAEISKTELVGSVTKDGIWYNTSKNVISLVIPDSVNTIGDRAFYECVNLTSVTIPDSVSVIDEAAFFDCRGLTSITIPDGVSSMGKWVFEKCSNLKSVTIGNGVAKLEYGAFMDCSSLESITIGRGVSYVGEYAFERCGSLSSIDIPEGVATIDYGAFHDCSSLESITIGNGVESIGGYLFDSCVKLKNITFGSNVKCIGEAAFLSCGSLESIAIPDSVNDIGKWLFQDCVKLKSVTIGSGVRSIEYGTFINCGKLKSIIFQGTKTQWNALEKGEHWDRNTGNYTVRCTDGNIKK